MAYPDNHLRMIQGVINRLADNSAQLKTWAVSLAGAVLIFTGLSGDPHWIIVFGGGVPVVLFWMMDAQYLRLERCYRQLYRAVADGQTIPGRFGMDYRPYANDVDSVLKTALSWSVMWFYPALLAVMIALALFLAMAGDG